jgi:hypothetical protein
MATVGLGRLPVERGVRSSPMVRGRFFLKRIV